METVARPHQGGYLLCLGIVSVLASLFVLPLGIFAWYRAHRDLAAMNAGHMDAGGRNLTLCARLLGVVATVIFVLLAGVIAISLSVPSVLHTTRVVTSGG